MEDEAGKEEAWRKMADRKEKACQSQEEGRRRRPGSLQNSGEKAPSVWKSRKADSNDVRQIWRGGNLGMHASKQNLLFNVFLIPDKHGPPPQSPSGKDGGW